MGCDNCRPQCPTGAISVDDGRFWINPVLCNDCEGFYAEPQCLAQCPASIPVPYQAKKGRAKAVDVRPITSPDLFPNGKTHPFASAIVIWEACNLLSQRQLLSWNRADDRALVYQRSTHQGRGSVKLQVVQLPERDGPNGATALNPFDIRAACLHLIYAAYATMLDKPWEQEFVISDRQIEEYLGLDKRKDLSKPAKLTLIKELAQQPCWIQTTIHFPQQGNVRGFSVEDSQLWHLLEVQHHFQEDEIGCQHLIGLTFRIRAGLWAKYCLNKQGYRERSAFYQYGNLPKSVLSLMMSMWQQHEGATRMLLWLLFKTRMGKEQRITVPTLMRVAYGEEKVLQVSAHREERKRLIRAFENDLAVLNNYGLKPVFDQETYPPEIQPLWAKLADLPDDAEEALEFWMNDGNRETRITDAGPRGKWNLLMNARILSFELPADWDQSLLSADKQTKKKRRSQSSKETSHKANRAKLTSTLSGEQIIAARKTQGWSQRELAERTGKSQSWIRDIENGRFRAKAADQMLLRKILNLG